MFGFGYLMVPMYNIICDITGLNGKTGRVSANSITEAPLAEEREIIVEFTANVNQSGAWVFRPDARSMVVKPGTLYHASYYAENLSSQPAVAQATPSVTPFAAAKYFNKTECFCFTRQAFEAKGSMHMPLTFIIDPEIPINVDRVTLSYTFFRSPDQS
jgi:cytochrome c oxidase assembly protein subunit 11